MTDDQAQRPFFAAASLAGQQAVALLRLDAQLLDLEMKQKGWVLALSGAWGVASVILLATGALVCVFGLVAVLVALGLPPFAAAFVVGALSCVVGGLCGWRARALLKGWSPVPQRTMAQLRQDAEALREGLRHGIG